MDPQRGEGVGLLERFDMETIVAEKTMADIAETMRDIDFTMLVTRGADGTFNSRPMSNNRDVDFDGDSWFFTFEATTKVRDIKRDPSVGMTMQGKGGLLGKPPIFLAIDGNAELIGDKAAFEAHWQPDLERWFEQGVDTPGLMLVKVRADRIQYWDGEDQGEVTP